MHKVYSNVGSRNKVQVVHHVTLSASVPSLNIFICFDDEKRPIPNC